MNRQPQKVSSYLDDPKQQNKKPKIIWKVLKIIFWIVAFPIMILIALFVTGTEKDMKNAKRRSKYVSKKKLFVLVLFMGLIVGCAPGKSGKMVFVDVYCDSCHIKVNNSDGNNFIETVYDGDVAGYKRISVERYESNQSCVRAVEFTNYDTTTTFIYYIEALDTLATEIDGIAGFCN